MVKNLCKEMIKAADYSPIVLIIDWKAPSPIFEEFEGIKVVRWRIRGFHEEMNLLERLIYAVWRKQFRYQFKKFCNAYNVEFINYHYPQTSAFSLCASIENSGINIPVCLSFHGTDVSSLASLLPAQIDTWRKFVAGVENVVVCSNDLGQKLVRMLDIKMKYQTLYSGVDVKSMCANVINKSKSQDRIILNIAKFEEQKGQLTLLLAFSELADDYPGLRLVFVGAQDKELAILEERVKLLGLTEVVNFHTNVEHTKIGEFYKDAEIFCLPSKNEGFGLVLLEAGAFELPVLASSVGGIPELIDNRNNGMLFKAGDIKALSKSLRYLLDDPAAAKQMGRVLHEQVVSNFSWESVCAKYTAIARKRGGNG